jgi:3-hydroxybutyryl-CoA dehydrogenase
MSGLSGASSGISLCPSPSNLGIREFANDCHANADLQQSVPRSSIALTYLVNSFLLHNIMASSPIKSVLILGAGWTGQQIAAQMIGHGVEVVLADKNAASLGHAIDWAIEFACEQSTDGHWRSVNAEQLGELISGVDLRLVDSASSEPNSDVSTKLANVDLAIECVSEQVATKRRVLRQLSEILNPTCIIASNSSYFVPSMLAPYVSHGQRFAHFHFHVPVDRATVVDIVPGPDCDAEVLERLSELATRIGQTPLVQSVENPGYIFNWILQSTLKSALQLVDRGVATPEQVDVSWKTVTGMPLGPFGIMDRIGLDVIEHVLANGRWIEPPTPKETLEELEALIQIVRQQTRDGRLGTKTGGGFFDYTDPKASSKDD